MHVMTRWHQAAYTFRFDRRILFVLALGNILDAEIAQNFVKVSWIHEHAVDRERLHCASSLASGFKESQSRGVALVMSSTNNPQFGYLKKNIIINSYSVSVSASWTRVELRLSLSLSRSLSFSFSLPKFPCAPPGPVLCAPALRWVRLTRSGTAFLNDEAAFSGPASQQHGTLTDSVRGVQPSPYLQCAALKDPQLKPHQKHSWGLRPNDIS